MLEDGHNCGAIEAREAREDRYHSSGNLTNVRTILIRSEIDAGSLAARIVIGEGCGYAGDERIALDFGEGVPMYSGG